MLRNLQLINISCRNEMRRRDVENVRMTTINYESGVACVVLFMSVKLHV